VGVEPKLEGKTHQNGWFIIMEIPIKMDDLGGKTHHFFRKHPFDIRHVQTLATLKFGACFSCTKGLSAQKLTQQKPPRKPKLGCPLFG